MELGAIIEQIKDIAQKLEHDKFMPKAKRMEMLALLDNLLTKRKLLEVEKLKQYASLADILDKRSMYALANEIDEVIKYSAEMGKLLDMDQYRHKKMMKQRFNNRQGTVISGTFREQDLIPAFMKELEELDPNKAMKLYEEYSQLFIDLNDMNYSAIDSAEAHDLIYNDLIPILSRLAPDDMYFGSHPGDGSDFGWWPMEEEENAADDFVGDAGPEMSGNADQDVEIADDVFDELIIDSTEQNPGEDNKVIDKMNNMIIDYIMKKI